MKYIPVIILALFSQVNAFAEIATTEVDYKKNNRYVQAGVYYGGTKDGTHAVLKDIRWANNGEYERVVIDLEPPKHPYFQVSIENEQKRIVITFWNRTSIEADIKSVLTKLNKSKIVKSAQIYPGLDDELSILSIYLKAATPTEVFSLANPNRIILDLKYASKLTHDL